MLGQSGTPAMTTVVLQLPTGQYVSVQVPVSSIASPVATTPVIQQPVTTSPQVLQPQTQVLPVVMGNGAGGAVPGAANFQTLLTLPVPGFSVNKNTVDVSPKPQTVGIIQQNFTTVSTVLSPTSSQTGLQTVLLPNTVKPAAVASDSGKTSAQNHSALREALTLPVSSTSDNLSGSQSYTKQRLKAALQQHATPTQQHKIAQIFQVKPEQPVVMETVSSTGTVSSPEDVPRQYNTVG